MGNYSLDPCVEDELWEIWKYIAKDNPDAATHVVEAAYATFAIRASEAFAVGAWLASTNI